MQISPNLDKQLHSRLPIDSDEKILAVYKHHWFAYAASWLIGGTIVVVVMGLAVALTTLANDGSALAQHRSQILALAGAFSVLVMLAACIPVYLRSQEQLVLTEEALVQVLQPSLLASKIDQLSLQHIADVSVRQDFLGTLFGYGHITIETPGEQDNYEYAILPNPHESAREIISAHENLEAALQGGHLPTTLSKATPRPDEIDPQQYQQFLAYQQMVARQQGQQAAQADDPTGGPVAPDPTEQNRQ
ncbi:MAG TPA: PH domain-containing protein [Candidatus Saccharimonadales bacterium]|nr:PH domain-containing protein [Candidatus Saccharimonadales bacterium]